MATTPEILRYYADLLIIQYRGKPKAYATTSASVAPIVMDQLPLAVQNAFDIDTAVGAQLDVIGKYAGISRTALTLTTPIVLGDEDYRLLIRMKIIVNNSGSSLATIQDLIHMFFDGILFVFDYKNMHMSYYFDSNFGSPTLAEVFVRQGLLPKPMGVGLGALIYAPNLVFFGFRSYPLAGVNVVGFNSYGDYQMDWPWLSYQDAISI